jgi:hypothetical protein
VGRTAKFNKTGLERRGITFTAKCTAIMFVHSKKHNANKDPMRGKFEWYGGSLLVVVR